VRGGGRRLLWAVAALPLLAAFPGCERGKQPGVQFSDRAAEAGIAFHHTDGSSGRYWITETLASGVALFDYDGDGRLDIYFVNGRPLPPGSPPAAWARDSTPRNALYHQEGPGGGGLPHFKDVTEKAGVPGTGFGVGACVGDYDGDGHLDLFIAQLGPDLLYRNKGDGTFSDVTREAGVGDPALSACAAFGDLDGDGYLDLYLSNYCSEDFQKDEPCLMNNVRHYCSPSTYQPVPDNLFMNNGNATFRDASDSSGIRKVKPGRGLGVVICDFDNDGFPDIYVANDGSENFLFHNLGNATFQNIGLESNVALDMNGDEQGSMGVDVADYDGDQLFDIVVTNFQKQANSLYHNEGNLSFQDLAMKSGISAVSLPWVKWGTRIFDYDNDGVLDLFVANGHMEDRIELYDQSTSYLQNNQLFRGRGDGTFEEVTRQSGPGLALRRSSRGAAFGDLDNDGDVDVVVLCSRDRPLLLMNDGGNRGNWVELELAGRPPNRFAIGARVTLVSGKRAYLSEVRSGGSYGSQNDLRLHFGLGTGSVDRVEVRWPDRKTETVAGVRPRHLNRIVEGRGVVEEGARVP
jgi:hypothetical protein